MLEFYPVPTSGRPPLKLPARFRFCLSGDAVPGCAHALRAPAALLAIAFVAGCAQTGTMRDETALPPAASPAVPRPGTPSNVEPPAPAVNLSGFPLPYRQGYADGCASATGAERKDVARYGSDGNYRTGWQDGLALCRKK